MEGKGNEWSTAMAKTQEQLDHDEWVASERALAARWQRLLAMPVAGDPDPQRTGPTVDELAAMDHETYGAQRQALGLRNGSEFPGTTSFADHRDAQIAAANLAAKGQPDALPAHPVTERRPSGSTIFGIDTPNARTHQSPWTG
jgi:hypothetical protein